MASRTNPSGSASAVEYRARRCPALHVDQAQRAAVRVAQQKHGTPPAVGRVDGDFAVRRGIDLEAARGYGVHRSQQPPRVVEGGLLRRGEVLLCGFVQRLFQIAQGGGERRGRVLHAGVRVLRPAHGAAPS